MSPPPLDEEARALLALNLVPGLGPRLTRALFASFGSARRALAATAADLEAIPHIGPATAVQMAHAFRSVSVDEEIATMAGHGVWALCAHHELYPTDLNELADPPSFLYAVGSLLPCDRKAVAIVGSRQCTAYGRRVTERLATGLAKAGVTVVSGLARGIDGIAHRAALAAGGRTLAVVAGGLATVYPPEHAELAKEVAAAGAVISEAPMRMRPLPEMFPQRNRLISALSRGVVIVEAATKSGALITAKHALEQGREVLAVPGPVDSETSSGPLQLLKDGAALVRDVDDILSALGDLPSPVASSAPPPPPPSLSPVQERVWTVLADSALHMDELIQAAGLSVAEVSNALLLMELSGAVRRLPGNRFERKK
jgi:DNA processing protein